MRGPYVALPSGAWPLLLCLLGMLALGVYGGFMIGASVAADSHPAAACQPMTEVAGAANLWAAVRAGDGARFVRAFDPTSSAAPTMVDAQQFLAGYSAAGKPEPTWVMSCTLSDGTAWSLYRMAAGGQTATWLVGTDAHGLVFDFE